VRAQTDHPCGRPAVATILGVRFCEWCTREQTDYFALGELTQIPRGKSSVAEGVGYAARAPRLGYSVGTRGARRGLVARSAKVSLLLVVASILFLAATACSGTGRQASGGSAATQAKAKPETTAHQHARSAEVTAEGDGARGALARVGDAGGAVARTGGAVARVGNARARAGDAAREKHGGAAPGKNAAGEDRFREDRPQEDRPQESHPQKLTLEVGGDPGTGFSGVCFVEGEEKTIEGRVPQRYVFELGDAGLECEIRKKSDGGALQVVVAGEGVRSVQHTGATEGTIRFTFSGGGGISQSTYSSISLNQTATAFSDRPSSHESR